MKKQNIVPLSCLVIYLIVAIRSGINPTERDTWLVEIITSAIPVVILSIMFWRGIKFSSLGYILMAILPVMHAIGAHYTFALVPSQWLSDLLGTDRNMYDRIAHASVGLYAYGIAQYIDYKKLTTSLGFKLMFAVFAIMALACVYELFEWGYAIMADPEAGIAILGSQGDIRDAQKDMLMDTIGAVVGVVIYGIFNKQNINSLVK